jgi:hypothetical protein
MQAIKAGEHNKQKNETSTSTCTSAVQAIQVLVQLLAQVLPVRVRVVVGLQQNERYVGYKYHDKYLYRCTCGSVDDLRTGIT